MTHTVDPSPAARRRSAPLLIGAEPVSQQVVVERRDQATCVQNEHGSVPKKRVVMSGHRLLLCLMDIGWSERQFARKAGQHQTTVVR